jgi:predicted phage terminase large subunit-like protein
MYLLDMIHGRWEFNELIENAKAFFQKNNCFINGKRMKAIYVEDKASGTSLAQFLRREGLPMIEWKPTDRDPRDKVQRAMVASVTLANGRIFLPKDAIITKELIDQCAAFPDAPHDDMVDAMTMAVIIGRKIY